MQRRFLLLGLFAISLLVAQGLVAQDQSTYLFFVKYDAYMRAILFTDQGTIKSISASDKSDQVIFAEGIDIRLHVNIHTGAWVTKCSFVDASFGQSLSIYNAESNKLITRERIPLVVNVNDAKLGFLVRVVQEEKLTFPKTYNDLAAISLRSLMELKEKKIIDYDNVFERKPSKESAEVP